MLKPTQLWLNAFPDAHAGMLVMKEVSNPSSHPDLEIRKEALVDMLRNQFNGMDPHELDQKPPFPAYRAYYKLFDKTYHVQAQLASILFKGKSIPSVSTLVEAMFMAELKNGLLTAGHDLDTLRLPVTLDVSTGEEKYTLMRGVEQT